nr:MAG TPA: hypothetical protein [Caudoviricetes sp.]
MIIAKFPSIIPKDLGIPKSVTLDSESSQDEITQTLRNLSSYTASIKYDFITCSVKIEYKDDKVIANKLDDKWFKLFNHLLGEVFTDPNVIVKKIDQDKGSADNPCVVYSINNTSISITNPIPAIRSLANVEGYGYYAGLTVAGVELLNTLLMSKRDGTTLVQMMLFTHALIRAKVAKHERIILNGNLTEQLDRVFDILEIE